jgi:hypothetical protein
MANLETDPYAGLNAAWRKFFNKFNEIDTLKVSEWREVHILAYICKRYEELFKNKFSVAIKGAPGKSPDVYITKRIIASLNTTNTRTIKEYIDWVYDVKIIPKRVHFRKIGFFLTEGFANEFLHNRMKKKIITRSTPLPEAFVDIAKDLGIDISTYGDIAFIQLDVERRPEDKENPRYILLGNLELLGLDLNTIKEMR